MAKQLACMFTFLLNSSLRIHKQTSRAFAACHYWTSESNFQRTRNLSSTRLADVSHVGSQLFYLPYAFIKVGLHAKLHCLKISFFVKYFLIFGGWLGMRKVPFCKWTSWYFPPHFPLFVLLFSFGLFLSFLFLMCSAS